MVIWLEHIGDGPDLSRVEVFLGTESSDCPGNGGPSVWPMPVSIGKSTASGMSLTLSHPDYLHHLGSLSRTNVAPPEFQYRHQAGTRSLSPASGPKRRARQASPDRGC
jgi:hypothetical protein